MQTHNETTTAVGRDRLHESSYGRADVQADIAEVMRHLSATNNMQVGLVVVSLHYTSAGQDGPSRALLAERARQSSAYLLQNLRTLVRKTDYVSLNQHNLYFVLPGANLQGALIVEERLWEALLWRIHNMGEQKAARPLEMTIGHAAYPEPQASPDDLLAAAGEVSKRFDERPERFNQRGAPRIEIEDQTAHEELPQLAKKLGIPYLSLLPLQLPQRVQQVVNAKLAHELHCYPVGRARNTLTVAMLNPQDCRALERLRQETGLHIFPVLAHPEALEIALQQMH